MSLAAYFRYFNERRPDWWIVAASAVAAVVLLVFAAQPARLAVSAHDHGGLENALATSLFSGVFHWQLMTVAMMWPLVLEPARHVAGRSFWLRRHRAIGAFLLGHFTVWSTAGAAATVLLLVVYGPQVRGFLVAAAFCAGAAWQLTAAKERASVACHRTTPLSPHGLRADRDCFLFGCSLGRACLANCWALMLACMFANHGISVLASCAVLSTIDRLLWRPNRGLLIAAQLGLACVYALSGL